jgi:hypothetical protein
MPLTLKNDNADKNSKIEYTYPAIRGVKISGGKYSYPLNNSLSPNFTYSSSGIFITGKAKTGYIVAKNHTFRGNKTHDYELVIEHQTETRTFYVVFPIIVGNSRSTLNKVINANNVITGETLDLNSDVKNPANIYNYSTTNGNVFVFETFINVNGQIGEKITGCPFNVPETADVKYTTGNQKFADEVVCGEEDVVAKDVVQPDTKYVFIMALVGFILLTVSLLVFSRIANTESIPKQTKVVSLIVAFVCILFLLGGSIVLYLKYDKALSAMNNTVNFVTNKNAMIKIENSAMYKTIFGAFSVIFTFIAVVAIFSIRGVYAPAVAEKPLDMVVETLGSKIQNSWKL